MLPSGFWLSGTSFGVGAVESRISRKTSEMWGTRLLVSVQSLLPATQPRQGGCGSEFSFQVTLQTLNGKSAEIRSAVAGPRFRGERRSRRTKHTHRKHLGIGGQ